MDFLRDLADKSRRSILTELRSGPRNVSELVAATGLKQPNLSNHLSKLREHGIVRSQKIGRQVFYSLASPEIEASLHGLLAERAEPDSKPCCLDELAKTYAKAACAGEEATCAAIIDQLIRQHVPLVRIYQQVIDESMQYVGRWYEAEAIDEGQEHLASAITERMMARVLHYSGPVDRQARRAVLGCCPGNWHAIGIRMISDFLRLSGWKSYYLGANVPTASFLAAVREHEPDLVLVSCTAVDDLAAALELTTALVELRRNGMNFVIGVGGRQPVEHPKQFIEAGADFVAPNLFVFSEEVLPRLEQRERAPLGVFTNHKKLD